MRQLLEYILKHDKIMMAMVITGSQVVAHPEMIMRTTMLG